MGKEESVVLTVTDRIGTIEIRRESALNALNVDVLEGLSEAVAAASNHPEKVRAILLRGAGEKAFVAGADIKHMMNASRSELFRFVELGHRVMREIECSPTPVIAVIQGHSLGGGLELALACDLIIASSAAKFGQPEVKLGLIPGFGGTQRLCQRVGIGGAKRLILTGEPITADEAFRLGIVDYLVPPSELDTTAREVAHQIASRGAASISTAKQAIEQFYLQAKLAGLRFEAEAFAARFTTDEAREGLAAFVEKRPAKFN